MIFFVADQVAGAEYFLPLLKNTNANKCPRYRVFCSDIASRVFERHAILCSIVSSEETERVLSLFEEHMPNACIMSATGNSRLERAFVLASRANGISSIQCVDTWLNYGSRFNYGDDRILPDKILVPGTAAKEAMISEGFPREILHVVGQPYFEYLRDMTPPSLAGDRLLVVTQPISRFYGKRLGYDEIIFLSAVIEAAFESGFGADLIDICVHPAESLDAYKTRLSLEFGDMRGLSVQQGAMAPLSNYATVLGMFSSVLVQAASVLVPSASFQPGEGEDLCVLSAMGLIPRLRAKADISAFLLAPEIREGCFAFSRSLDGSCARFEQLVVDHVKPEMVHINGH